jgi:hypothetical protein
MATVETQRGRGETSDEPTEGTAAEDVTAGRARDAGADERPGPDEAPDCTCEGGIVRL